MSKEKSGPKTLRKVYFPFLFTIIQQTLHGHPVVSLLTVDSSTVLLFGLCVLLAQLGNACAVLYKGSMPPLGALWCQGLCRALEGIMGTCGIMAPLGSLCGYMLVYCWLGGGEGIEAVGNFLQGAGRHFGSTHVLGIH
ncbi:hypothetical protein J3A83DRAFT_4398293 [Scleroderma citrinum]